MLFGTACTEIVLSACKSIGGPCIITNVRYPCHITLELYPGLMSITFKWASTIGIELRLIRSRAL